VRKSLYAAAAVAAPIRKTLFHGAKAMENTDKELIGFQNSRFNQKLAEMQLDKLVQLHLIMEHLILMQINLDNCEYDRKTIINLFY